jgi:hypothetical protein
VWKAAATRSARSREEGARRVSRTVRKASRIEKGR